MARRDHPGARAGRGRRAAPLALALCPLAWLAAGCGCSGPAEARRPVRVLLVGLDGASWTFIDPLRARGALPNLDRLIREGVRAPLRTLSPSLSPAVWTSMVTGKSPAAHGIEDFYTKDAEGRGGLASSQARKVEALWTIVSGSGRRVGFVGWWVTWPAEKVDGYMVSEHFLRPSHDRLEQGTYPLALTAELDAAIPADWPWLRRVLDSGQLKLLSDRTPGQATSGEQRLREARFFYEQDHRGEQAALHLLAHRARPDLLGFTSRKIDLASHYVWSFLSGDRGPEAMSRALEPVYRYEDDLVGRLIAAAGPAVDVLVVSDHGFERVGAGWDHKEGAPDGIFIAWGPSFRRGVTLDPVSVYDVAPTVLHVLGLPVARDMEGRVPEEALAGGGPVRWVATYESGRRAATGAARSPMEEEVREQLRALGYVQ